MMKKTNNNKYLFNVEHLLTRPSYTQNSAVLTCNSFTQKHIKAIEHNNHLNLLLEHCVDKYQSEISIPNNTVMDSLVMQRMLKARKERMTTFYIGSSVVVSSILFGRKALSINKPTIDAIYPLFLSHNSSDLRKALSRKQSSFIESYKALLSRIEQDLDHCTALQQKVVYLVTRKIVTSTLGFIEQKTAESPTQPYSGYLSVNDSHQKEMIVDHIATQILGHFYPDFCPKFLSI